MTRLALAAAGAALADAGFDPDQPPGDGLGVVTAGTAGGYDFGQRELEKLWALGPNHVSAYQSFAWFYAVNTGQISIRHGLQGPGGVLVADQAGGLDVLAQARRNLRRGTPSMLAGAVDSALCPWGLIAQIPTGHLSRVASPDRAYLPFDEAASGHVIGEGGALLVLESAEAARERGAPQVYGEIAGHGASFDPAPESGRPRNFGQAARLALADAGIGPDEIDGVFADASGDPEMDRAEADMLSELVGPRGLPVTAPKAGTGRLAAGGPAVDVAAALLALRDQVLPPTPNVTSVPSDYALDLVIGEPRRTRLRTLLVLARGYGGFNSAVVVRSFTD
jgi:act minimal PKS chain-length factor (CLF/KS beta)